MIITAQMERSKMKALIKFDEGFGSNINGAFADYIALK
jgi:hypothetical protein